MLVSPETGTSEAVEAAARDYLDANCAHCHSPKGIEGVTSQFFLNHDNEDQFNLGICKRPGSAGEGGVDREFDIVPATRSRASSGTGPPPRTSAR